MKRLTKGKLISALLAAALLTVCLMTACQPTPEEAVVVNKNAGALVSAINANSKQTQAKAYEAPERLNYTLDVLPGNYSIVFDADVDVPNQTAWPVFTVEPADITQEQADAVRKALLGDTVLYKPGEFRSREEIQQSIDSYENELQLSVQEEGHEEIVGNYQQILKDLYEEYERTPEDLKLEQADTNFAFMESMVQARQFVDKETVQEDGGIRYEWTDEARRKAVEAGCENIYGVCWMDSGRKMEFNAGNGEPYSGLTFYVAEGNLVKDPGVTYSLEEAIKKGDALLKAAGFDFTLVEALTQTTTLVSEDGDVTDSGPMYHLLTYKRTIEGVPLDNIGSCIDQSRGDDYIWAVPGQETISIQMDDYGIYSFGWGPPINVVSTDNANVSLMPFEDIKRRIEQQLKVQTLWDENDSESIESRRLQVYKIKLSYLLVAKANDMEHYYLLPVWNVCGDMYYHYKDSYPAGEGGRFILDENNERNAWRMRNDERDYSILTLNALDGSVIPRRPWT